MGGRRMSEFSCRSTGGECVLIIGNPIFLRLFVKLQVCIYNIHAAMKYVSLGLVSSPDPTLSRGETVWWTKPKKFDFAHQTVSCREARVGWARDYIRPLMHWLIWYTKWVEPTILYYCIQNMIYDHWSFPFICFDGLASFAYSHFAYSHSPTLIRLLSFAYSHFAYSHFAYSTNK